MCAHPWKNAPRPTLASIKHARTLNVPQSVSQSVCMIIILIVNYDCKVFIVQVGGLNLGISKLSRVSKFRTNTIHSFLDQDGVAIDMPKADQGPML